MGNYQELYDAMPRHIQGIKQEIITQLVRE